ncbi:aminotransferase class I/II-fold pyridoxal phosphate-dependent enzyme [Helicovermis profundi]|uniref:Aminotransferase class I/II-fold pyridoxal phosphate-dependent enzyme n=1 Tax=Helicovermis profundi TaxID=3065157 RepID=A0AAU9ERH7_9FIRM|nr:aminotransferase class I/II-fold pyridoxal phosphate-dependent enzyme [Clostridia bacterium S502]
MKDQNVTPLFDALKDYHSKKVIPFDVPGHKHGRGLKEYGDFLGNKVLEVDVNSMKCLDILSNPVSVIKEAEELLAELYGAKHSFFLVNGSSAGVQGMIMSVCKPGDKIILPRNAHKSAVNGIIMSGAIPIYITPEYNKDLGISFGITIESVKKTIAENRDAKAIFVINPTYFGASSNLKEIINIAHSSNMSVLVDEAHGSHLMFHDDLPESAIKLGADMSAISLHKTGGSLTQSSALLMNSSIIDSKYVRKILNLYQTTSASYLLMTSIDIARKNLALRGNEIMQKVLELSRYARNELNKIEGVYAFGKELENTKGVYKFDETKLVINVADLGLTGFRVYDILRDEFNIQMELGDAHNTLAIISIGDEKDQIDALINAMKDISKKYMKEAIKKVDMPIPSALKLALSPRDAFYAEKESINLSDSIGRISGESIMAYPPGIPVFTPGEVIDERVIKYIDFLKKQDTVITDLEDQTFKTIKVIKE